jgi:citrate lyase beta subunit
VPAPSALRSVLFVPGTRPDRFPKAIAAGADAVVFDLEDSVESTRKDEARKAVAAWLAQPATGSVERLVRINAAGSTWLASDLAWLATIESRYEGIVLPKVETPDDIVKVARKIPSRRVIPLLETSRGILRAAQIVAADADVSAVFFGAEDLTAELGIPRTLEGEELLVARSQVVLAAVSIGADPIDAVFVDIFGLENLRRDAQHARALGFSGKMAIHPDQIPIINKTFSPTADEIAAARKILQAEEAAHAKGEVVFRLEGKMVDAPVITRAKRVLALAAARPRA